MKTCTSSPKSDVSGGESCARSSPESPEDSSSLLRKIRGGGTASGAWTTPRTSCVIITHLYGSVVYHSMRGSCLDASARFLARNVFAEGALEQLDLDGLLCGTAAWRRPARRQATSTTSSAACPCSIKAASTTAPFAAAPAQFLQHSPAACSFYAVYCAASWAAAPAQFYAARAR